MKGIKHEESKLTKKQLQTGTSMGTQTGRVLTIGELTQDQLRVELYRLLKQERGIDRGIEKALRILENIAP